MCYFFSGCSWGIYPTLITREVGRVIGGFAVDPLNTFAAISGSSSHTPTINISRLRKPGRSVDLGCCSYILCACLNQALIRQ